MATKLLHKVEREVHWPTLNTVIMVEDTIKKLKDSAVNVAEIKRNLPRQVNHNTLMIILEYLERSNKIFISLKGITWVHNPNRRLREALNKGLEL